MPTPHKHAEVIKAWADGAEIQALTPNYGSHGEEGESWKNCPNPQWSTDYKYRIKPKTIKFRNFLWKACSTRDPVVHSVMYEDDVKEPRICWQGFIRWVGPWQEIEI